MIDNLGSDENSSFNNEINLDIPPKDKTDLLVKNKEDNISVLLEISNMDSSQSKSSLDSIKFNFKTATITKNYDKLVNSTPY